MPNPSEVMSAQHQQATPGQPGMSPAQEAAVVAAADDQGNVISADFGFDVGGDPAEALAALADGAQGQPQPAPTESPITAMFRGESREYSRDAAQNMIQQYLAMQEMNPVLGVANQLKQMTGITDPKELAAYMMNNMKSPAVAAVVDEVAAAAQGVAQSQTPPAGQVDSPLIQAAVQAQSKSDAEVNAAVDSFFESNQLTPTPEMHAAMSNLVRWGDVLGTLGANIPQVIEDLSAAKQLTMQVQQQAMYDAVGTAADRAVTEMGIEDNEENMADFTNWLQTQNDIMPGYAGRVAADPQAMDKAIRAWGTSLGVRKAQKEAALQEQNVNADLVRAGGDMPGARAHAGAPVDFDQDMLANLPM